MPSVLNFTDFEARLQKAASAAPPMRQCVGANGVELAYKIFAPAGDFDDVLVFYHGGGANMHAGYGPLATELAARSSLAVCLTDMRGHGSSGGRRGDADSPDEVWEDVDRLIARLTREFPGRRIHLGGHSSAVGMLLNYRTLHSAWAEMSSFVFVAPEFGYRAGLYRGSGWRSAFADVQLWPFLLNAFSGGHLGGRLPAVTLNYEGSRLALPNGCVTKYTVNMSRAVTPQDPADQLARLDLPTWIGIAGEDELIDPLKLDAFLARHAPPSVVREILPAVTHLGAILDACPRILAFLETHSEERKSQ